MRDAIKNDVNKIIKEEHGKEINFNNLLTDSEIDSFGYAMLFIPLDEKYKCFDEKYLNSIDYKTYTLEDLCKRIEDVH